MTQRLVSCDGFGLSKKSSFLVLFLIFLFIGCSSGGGGGSSDTGASEDAALYQQALSTYQAGDYSQALTEFQNLAAQYPNSIYLDNARYYSARCHHELANFTTARNLYEEFVATFPASNYVDNAEFYHGKSYFDEAGLQTEEQTEFDLLQTAITELAAFTTNHSTSSLLDSAQYYLGRSYHDQAGLLQNNSNLAMGTTPAQLFAEARTNYDLVIANTASVYADNAQYYKAQAFHDEGSFTFARDAYQVLVNFGTSNWADDARYQIAKTYYDDALQTVPVDAMGKFDTAVVEFNSMILAYPTSNRVDSAYYFKGRSYQRQADLIRGDLGQANPELGLSDIDMAAKYDAARVVFQQFLVAMPSSTWADNALYQTGATYYDEAAYAEANTDYTTMRVKLSSAIGEFDALLSDSLYQTTNSADNAQYYLGRSYQMISGMPDSERTGVIGGVNFAAVNYDTARNAFNVVIQNFATSAWVDNAYYQIGETYYAEATLAIDQTTAVAAYNNALYNYNQVIVLYAGISIWEDNAAYSMGMIYHDTGNCVAEKAALEYVTNINNSNFSAITIDNINNNHLADLANAPTPTGTHLCDTTNFPGIDTSYSDSTLVIVSLEQRLFAGGVNRYETA